MGKLKGGLAAYMKSHPKKAVVKKGKKAKASKMTGAAAMASQRVRMMGGK